MLVQRVAGGAGHEEVSSLEGFMLEEDILLPFAGGRGSVGHHYEALC